MPTQLKTPVGRIVWGNPLKPQIKKHQDGAQKGQPILKDGQPVSQWSFGVAFNKAEFQSLIWPLMAQEAAAGYPNGVPPRFAWKYQDGDGIDSKGKPFRDREGYAGCYVLAVSTTAFAPPVYQYVNGGWKQLTEGEIKTGDFVALALNLQVNVATGTDTPSLYVNPQAIEFVAYGQPINNAANPDELFGNQPQQRQLPPGASLTPISSAGSVAMPGTMPMGQPVQQPMQGYQQPVMQPGMMPGAPMQQPQPAGYPQPMGQPGMQPVQPQYQQPGQMPPPAHDFVQNAGMQPVQPQYQQPGMMPGAPMQQPMQGYPQPGGMPAMPGQMPPR